MEAKRFCVECIPPSENLTMSPMNVLAAFQSSVRLDDDYCQEDAWSIQAYSVTETRGIDALLNADMYEKNMMLFFISTATSAVL